LRALEKNSVALHSAQSGAKVLVLLLACALSLETRGNSQPLNIPSRAPFPLPRPFRRHHQTFVGAVLSYTGCRPRSAPVDAALTYPGYAPPTALAAAPAALSYRRISQRLAAARARFVEGVPPRRRAHPRRRRCLLRAGSEFGAHKVFVKIPKRFVPPRPRPFLVLFRW
jgi:hypothetical protein